MEYQAFNLFPKFDNMRPIVKLSLFCIWILCAEGSIQAQMGDPRFLVDLNFGIASSQISSSKSAFALNYLQNPGRDFTFSFEKIIKPKIGLGLQIGSVRQLTFDNALTEDAIARLKARSNMDNIRVTEDFPLNFNNYLLSVSWHHVIGNGLWQFKFSAGLGRLHSKFSGYGFIMDSPNSGPFSITNGTTFQYLINNSSFLTIQPQINYRHALNYGQNSNLSIFIGMKYSFQRIRFEYVEKIKHNTTKALPISTLAVWRQNIQFFTISAGLTYILTAK